MEGNFRNVLIIISAIIIGAIFVHGLWTIRKNKNPYKLKASKNTAEPVERGFDPSGFDQDGVSQVRVIKKDAADDVETESSTAESSTTESSTTEPEFPPESSASAVHPKDVVANETTFEVANNEPNLGDMSFELSADDGNVQAKSAEQNVVNITNKHIQEPVDKAATFVEAAPPVYQEPVTQAKPERIKTIKKSPSKVNTLKRNQMEINFGEEGKSAKVENKPTVESQVIVLSVVTPENQIMSGAALLPMLLTLGMKYGEMNIFHRHQDNAGNGKITFSLANMLNPGTFDLDSMESFATQGVTLFMTLPNEGDPFEVFAQMVAAARQIAAEFNAQVLDDKRSVMTKQTEQHYMSKIREFDRQSRIASL